MATFKPGEDISGISGKVGGTSFSKQRQYNTIRNSPQSNKSPKPEQATRRFLNGAISQQWRELSPAQRASYETEAPFYTYKNAFGADVPRTGYGLFLYLAQNLVNFDIKAPGTAPAFAAVTAPIISIDSATPTELIISGTDINSDYGYNIWAKPNNRPGQNPSKKYIELCGSVTPGQLTAGVDVLPLINSKFKFEYQYPFIFLGVEAVNLTTGNKVSDFDLILVDTTEAVPSLELVTTRTGFTLLANQYILHNQNIWYNQRGNLRVNLRYLTNPYDLSLFSSSINGTLFTSQIIGTYFSDDGLFRIALRNLSNTQRLLKFSHNAPFAVNTETILQDVAVGASGIRMSLFVKNDGTRIAFRVGPTLQIHSLSTPFDLTTMSLLSSFTFFNNNTNSAFQLSDNGRYLYYFINSIIRQYEMSTPFDLSTLNLSPIYTQDLSLAFPIVSTNFCNLYITPDGQYLNVSIYTTTSTLINCAVFKLTVPYLIGSIFTL